MEHLKAARLRLRFHGCVAVDYLEANRLVCVGVKCSLFI